MLGRVRGALGRVRCALGRVRGALGRVRGALGRVCGALGRVRGALGRVRGGLGRVRGALGRVRGNVKWFTKLWSSVEVHNTNFRILRHFLTIFRGNTVWPIFMKFSGFVYHVKD